MLLQFAQAELRRELILKRNVAHLAYQAGSSPNALVQEDNGDNTEQNQ